MDDEKLKDIALNFQANISDKLLKENMELKKEIQALQTKLKESLETENRKSGMNKKELKLIDKKLITDKIMNFLIDHGTDSVCKISFEIAEILENENEVESCQDALSREKVYEIIEQLMDGSLDEFYTKKAIHELPSVQPEQRWISVSDRLPESDEDVLVTNGIGIYIGWIDPTDNGWRVDSESEYFMDDILAWMLLPEPFKAERR